MTSKSTGEPPLLASVSVLTAFQAAITAAKQGLADMHAGHNGPQSSSNGTAAALDGNLEAGDGDASADGYQTASKEKETHDEGIREQVLRQLQAPVTVKEVKRVLGQLHLPHLLLSSEE